MNQSKKGVVLGPVIFGHLGARCPQACKVNTYIHAYRARERQADRQSDMTGEQADREGRREGDGHRHNHERALSVQFPGHNKVHTSTRTRCNNYSHQMSVVGT